VGADLEKELPAFRGIFQSEDTDGEGKKWGLVLRPDNEQLEKVEMHRITPETEGAQTSDPIAEPQIEKPQETEIPVTPKMDDFHTSSLKQASTVHCSVSDCDRVAHDNFEGKYYCPKHLPAKKEASEKPEYKKCEVCHEDMVEKDKGAEVCPECEKEDKEMFSIKAEAEQLLKDVEGMGKTSYMFIKKGLEKHANDSAFEGNGWCRVWVQEDEVASSSKYAEALKLPDENARIAALKEIARELAHEALSLADSSASKVGVQSWFESLSPSDHDRIDWVALANPVNEEEEDAKFEQGMADKYGPDAAIPPQAKSSLEPKVEKKADGSVMDTKCEECGEPLGPEAFLSKWPVCGKCTRKRHKKVTGSGVEDVMRGQAGPRQIGKVWVKDNYDGEVMVYSTHFADKAEFDKWVASKIEGSTTKEIVKSEFPVAKKASDFEKGISQNKTSDCKRCEKPECGGLGYGCTCGCHLTPEERNASLKVKADEPAVEPKTQYKELKRAPAYVDREKAVPASPELDQVLSKLDALQQNLATLDTAKKQILAKAKEEVAKLEQSAERVQMEAELQESINKSGILIDALENKVVAWRDQIYTMQTQEVSYVPNITPKEMLEKIYAKFETAQQFVESVLNGMKSQAVNVLEKTLVRFPGKKSSLNKEASVIDQWNEELLAALKELSSPL
jgi:hypothetical protein